MMILRLSISGLTAVQVAISLLVIVSGQVAVAGLLRTQRSGPWIAIFLATTIATSVTGFLFHSKAIGAPLTTETLVVPLPGLIWLLIRPNH
ncbi:hypothetical protein SAMN05216570_2932 [Dyella sp. OK004]|uniref:hypothetical protein n=1 Tax=Dyella sp. OK004 TaxID=1855292 RepID=UPI0008E61BB0|nr:hypothetical protein [Dyella sp. OK004]SFS13728.1 hypothetical protein SAMN05216570_2932 [Dyella sp. OK004]